MAEGFAFNTVAFQTRDTTRLRRQEQAKKREEIIRKRRRETLAQNGRARQPSEPAIVEEIERTPPPTPDESMQIEEWAEPEKVMMMMTKPTNCCTAGPIRWANKNLYATSISFMLVFSSFIGLQNIQSSVNAELGAISLALSYAFYFLIGFVTPAIVRLFSTKYALLFGYICHTIYIASNFYPEIYILIPSSILLGIGSGPVWAGLSTHLATTAITVAPHVQESIDNIIARFTGVFFFIFQFTQIIGNVVSSLALYPYGDPIAVETEICNNTAATDISDAQRYSLLAVYILFDIAGILVLLIFVDRHSSESSSMMMMKSKIRRFCRDPFVDLLKVLLSWKMLLLGPLSLYNGMELSFAYSSFTQDVISNCVGVSQVGFATMVLGFFSATLSVVFGKLVKYIPRWVFGTVAMFINAFFLLFLQFYPLRPSFALIYLFAIFWGSADGIWNTLTASLVGILFPNDQEAAYSAFRIWMSLGFTFGFAITELKFFNDRLWTMFAVLIFSYILFILLELFYSKFGQRYICTRSLGILDGPQTKPEIDPDYDDMLTEAMLDAQIGMSTNTETMAKLHRQAYFGNSNYVPPPKRSATYSSEGNQRRLLGSRKKIVEKEGSRSPTTDIVEENVEEYLDDVEHSLVQTAAF